VAKEFVADIATELAAAEAARRAAAHRRSGFHAEIQGARCRGGIGAHDRGDLGVVHLLGITAALLGWIGPIQAAVLHLGPDVLVFVNSVKLLRVRIAGA
jgi:hypothetical protein